MTKVSQSRIASEDKKNDHQDSQRGSLKMWIAFVTRGLAEWKDVDSNCTKKSPRQNVCLKMWIAFDDKKSRRVESLQRTRRIMAEIRRQDL